MVNCTSAIAVHKLLWLDGQVFINSTSNTNVVSLALTPVNDSIHNKIFTCRAVQMGAVEKHIRVIVSGKISFYCLCSFE